MPAPLQAWRAGDGGGGRALRRGAGRMACEYSRSAWPTSASISSSARPPASSSTTPTLQSPLRPPPTIPPCLRARSSARRRPRRCFRHFTAALAVVDPAAAHGGRGSRSVMHAQDEYEDERVEPQRVQVHVTSARTPAAAAALRRPARAPPPSQLRAALARRPSPELGAPLTCPPRQLRLESSDVFLLLPSILRHRIDESSPLWAASLEDLVLRRAELVVLLEGYAATTSQLVQARPRARPPGTSARAVRPCAVG